MVSDLKKMMKSWRESWRRDSKVASQAVILMFTPIIIELGFRKRAAWKVMGGDWTGTRCFFPEANVPWRIWEWWGRGGRQVSTSISTSPSPDDKDFELEVFLGITHPPPPEAVQLGPRQEHQQQSQTGKLKIGTNLHWCKTRRNGQISSEFMRCQGDL